MASNACRPEPLRRRAGQSFDDPKTREPLSAHDLLDLIDGVGLAADGQQRRGLGQIDRVDRALDLGADAYGGARTVGHGCGHGVLSGRQLRTVTALAVPVERLVLARADRVTS